MANNNNQQVDRKDPGYRDVARRLKDYKEVENMLTEDEAVLQASRCLACGTPFCHAYACPIANIVPETNEMIKERRWEDALQMLLFTHPFPEFTSRICPALCEGSCVKGINEEPVAIRQIEKMIIEKGFKNNWITPRMPHKRRQEKVAVIGSGPAGLAAANHLNHEGFLVTVFEKDLNPGGLLLYGIPNFKLEKNVVERRIKMMKDEGVIFECGVTVGNDISFNYLKKRFSAIIIAGGTQQPRDLKVPGRNLSGIFFATDFLKAQNCRIIGEELPETNNPDAKGKTVVILGGGDTGADCLGTALRQGAKKVYQVEIMPRPPENRTDENPWPQWPVVERTASSHEEGGIRLWSVKTVGFSGDSYGRLESVQCRKIQWISKAGKTIPEEISDSDFTINANMALLAMGFTGPGPDPLAGALGLERDQRDNILVDSNHMTSQNGVFSAGDMARGQSLVVKAIADGISAAKDTAAYIAAGNRLL